MQVLKVLLARPPRYSYATEPNYAVTVTNFVIANHGPCHTELGGMRSGTGWWETLGMAILLLGVSVTWSSV